MRRDSLRIAIGKDSSSWCDRFAQALELKIKQGYRVSYEVMNLGTRDWLNRLSGIDVVIWNPMVMGPKAALHYKEKVYFMEKHLNKVVVPNYATVWHFESKVAQSYIFEKYEIPTPHTSVSPDYRDATEALRQMKPPFIFKFSHGASGKYVVMVKDQSKALRKLSEICCHQLWREARQRGGSRFKFLLSHLNKPWFWPTILSRLRSEEWFNVAYIQEFIPGNDKDLRITAIGNRYAFGFWRKNRPNDFRASGSGVIDYQLPIPEAPLRYCLGINQRLGLDTMAYDVIFRNGAFVILEMSYTYLDSAVYDCDGHYVLQDDGELKYEKKHTWPQELWVEWALHRAEAEL